MSHVPIHIPTLHMAINTSSGERTGDGTRPILYGVSDFARIREKNAWFVDRTGKIRDLENTPYALFLRPRRFGKSLFVSILQSYYDVHYAARFEELFDGTDIGSNPTEERGKYFVLDFNFSAVKKIPAQVQDSFNLYAALRCDTFARRYENELPDGLSDRILSASDCIAKMNEITAGLQQTGIKLYVLIDEYDNFTNTILAESGLNAYNDLCHGDGFFKQFFTNLKDATTGTDAPVSRLFITGVSPVTMDDVTSGFNIGMNISLHPAFADLTGFRHDDLRAIADYYAPRCGFDAEKAIRTCLDWYDHYRFSEEDVPIVANTTLVLWLFTLLWQTGKFPNDVIDENLRTDYAKIRHLIVLNRRLNGNFHVLETLTGTGRLSEPLARSFQARELTRRENFTSLLFWFGITTITDAGRGNAEFGIPNEALRQIAAKMMPAAYSDIHEIDGRVYEINKGLIDFSFNGEWRPFVEILAAVTKENFAVRDAKYGESVVQSTLVALMRASGGPYFVRHEGEAGGGFYDIALVPQLDRWPDIDHAVLIELKYVKAGDPVPTPDVLAAIKAKAAEQLDRYAKDRNLVAEWHLCSGGGHVTLHRLVLVFHGGDCILQEEIS